MVGYTVRFRSKKSRHEGGTIKFVTTGISLRRLIGGNSSNGNGANGNNELLSLLQRFSHVAIDEVHERDINMDFLLILFRDVMHKSPDLKLVLLLATLDTESFGDYFSKASTCVLAANENAGV